MQYSFLLMWCFAGVENIWAAVAVVMLQQVVVPNGLLVALLVVAPIQKIQRNGLAGGYHSIDALQYQQIPPLPPPPPSQPPQINPTGWSLAYTGDGLLLLLLLF